MKSFVIASGLVFSFISSTSIYSTTCHERMFRQKHQHVALDSEVESMNASSNDRKISITIDFFCNEQVGEGVHHVIKNQSVLGRTIAAKQVCKGGRYVEGKLNSVIKGLLVSHQICETETVMSLNKINDLDGFWEREYAFLNENGWQCFRVMLPKL